MGGRRRKPQGRVYRWFERAALGAIMTAVAFVVERRLIKVLRKRGETTRSPKRDEAGDFELSASTKQVDDETEG